jgi:asparagine N-glycosylation enzyme membrane subunit Stt3
LENIIIIILYIIILFDIINIFKKKNKKVNVTYIIIFIATFIIISLYYLGVPIPSPSIVIEKFIISIIK